MPPKHFVHLTFVLFTLLHLTCSPYFTLLFLPFPCLKFQKGVFYYALERFFANFCSRPVFAKLNEQIARNGRFRPLFAKLNFC